MANTLPELGRIIAERVLFWEGDESSKLVVRIGEPKQVNPMNEGTLYYCPYSIENLDGMLPVEFRGGMDSVQALQKSIDAIRERLIEGEKEASRKLCWGHPSNVTTGF